MTNNKIFKFLLSSNYIKIIVYYEERNMASNKVIFYQRSEFDNMQYDEDIKILALSSISGDSSLVINEDEVDEIILESKNGYDIIKMCLANKEIILYCK